MWFFIYLSHKKQNVFFLFVTSIFRKCPKNAIKNPITRFVHCVWWRRWNNLKIEMKNGTFIEKQLVSFSSKKKAISEIRLRQTIRVTLGVSVCLCVVRGRERESSCLRWVKSKPLFVPPMQPMLRLGFNLKNDDDDELEAHPVSAKSTSIKFKIILIWPSHKRKKKMNLIDKERFLLFYGRKLFL